MLEPNVAKRVRDALFAQKYNLLLGAGVSLDSMDRQRKPLQSAEILRRNLCKLTGVNENSSLWRAANHLTPDQIESHLTRPFHGCVAGPTVSALTHFVWKMAFTLNIDDATEDAYESDSSRLQSLVPINFNREYEIFRNPQELPLVHVHGFARRPQDGYVFSLQDYATQQRMLNAWLHALSGLLVSEPFIIAGTSLFEPDLEYFLANKPSRASVLARAPSILVEPKPDAGTRKDCERLHLVLVEATLADFLAWMKAEFGPSPTPLTLLEPKQRPRVQASSTTHTSTAFFVDFDFVQRPTEEQKPVTEGHSHFIFGGPPAWEDIEQKRDVPLRDQLGLMDEARRWAATSEPNQVLCLSGRAGSGKSTTIRRVSVELAAQGGLQVFYVTARNGIDIESAIRFLSTVVDPILLTTDSLAEHGDELLDIMRHFAGKKRICIIGAERQYRMRLVHEILEEVRAHFFEAAPWLVDERIELVRRYSDLGLIAEQDALADPRGFAKSLADNTVAESVCRILNDFRPLQAIVRSLWNDSIADGRDAYLATALAFYCNPSGIRRDVILGMYPEEFLENISTPEAPLSVIPHPDDDTYLIPANTTLSTLLVKETAELKEKRLLEIAIQLANSLAPFVTPHTIRQRTAEARLAARLFDADGVMLELLPHSLEAMYIRTHEQWKWNSRYWTQRGLFVAERDIQLAIQHTRHATAIERHPFSLTALAKILFIAASKDKTVHQNYFSEAVKLMDETFRIESRSPRGRTRRAYLTAIDGTASYLKAGGKISAQNGRMLEAVVAEAAHIRAWDGEFQKRVELVTAAVEAVTAVKGAGKTGTRRA